MIKISLVENRGHANFTEKTFLLVQQNAWLLFSQQKFFVVLTKFI